MLVALCSVHAGGTVSSPAPELGGYLAAATAGQWLTFARPGHRSGGTGEGAVRDEWRTGQAQDGCLGRGTDGGGQVGAGRHQKYRPLSLKIHRHWCFLVNNL